MFAVVPRCIAVFLLSNLSQKNCPYLSCYLSKYVLYLIKIMKEIGYTMLNLDLSTCFISSSAGIDLLYIIIFLINRITEMFKKEPKRLINEIVKPSPQNPRKFFLLTEFQQ